MQCFTRSRSNDSFPFFFLLATTIRRNLVPGGRISPRRKTSAFYPVALSCLRGRGGREYFLLDRNKRMSPLNRGSPLGSRILPAGARPLPPPRFGGRPAITGMPQRIPLPPRMPSPPRMRRMPPLNRMFSLSDPRHRIPLPPPPPPQPPRPVSGGGGMSRLNGVPPLFPGGPRARGHLAPIAPSMGPRGPFMRSWPRRMLPPQMMPPMRPMRYNTNNGTLKGKPIRNAKKINNRAVRIFAFSHAHSPYRLFQLFQQLLLSWSYMTL